MEAACASAWGYAGSQEWISAMQLLGRKFSAAADEIDRLKTTLGWAVQELERWNGDGDNHCQHVTQEMRKAL